MGRTSTFPLGVTHKIELSPLKWMKEEKICVRILKDYLQSIRKSGRSISEEETVEQETETKENIDNDTVTSKGNIDSGKKKKDNDNDIEMSGTRGDIDQRKEKSNSLERNRKLRQVDTRAKSTGAQVESNLLTNTSSTPEIISKPKEKLIQETEKIGLIIEFKSTDVEEGEIVDKENNILLKDTYGTLEWKYLKPIGITNFIEYNEQKVQIFAPSMYYIFLYLLY